MRTTRETGLAILVLFQRFNLHADSSLELVAHPGGGRKSYLMLVSKLSTVVKLCGMLWFDVVFRYTEEGSRSLRRQMIVGKVSR